MNIQDFETEFQPRIDVPEAFFASVKGKIVRAHVKANEPGLLCGTSGLTYQAKKLGLKITPCLEEGARIQPGDTVAEIAGNPVQVVRGEELLIGTIAKTSGIATAAATACRLAGRIKVVAGGWKKMPVGMKIGLREALVAGGVAIRMLDVPFIYLDKNYVRISGSLGEALEKAREFPGRTIVIQIRGETDAIAAEAAAAVKNGAGVLMVDTGSLEDLRRVSQTLKQNRWRRRVKIAFAGNINIGDLENLQKEDIDILDIGRAVLDAPLLDFRYDVFEVKDS